MKKSVLLALALGFGLTACNKDEDVSSNGVYDVNSIEDMKVSKNFDWKTAEMATISIKGMDIPVDRKNKLVVKDRAGRTIMSKMVKMDEDNSVSFEISKGTSTVVIEAGGISKEVSLYSGQGEFDYLTDQGFNDEKLDNQIIETMMQDDMQFTDENE